ncbi:MAG: tyrosine-type recombinase/integrase, partial [Fibrobacteres bacterium]|nr:tyrosine-type recombinase/integrase [Fibrobacterota bacterium]
LIKLCKLTGVINWEIEIPNEKIVPLRDSRGVGLEDIRRLFKATEDKPYKIAIRDRAILHLLFDRGLRRAEVIKLDVEDVNIADASINIMGKGRFQKERLSLASKTIGALKEWLNVRGSNPGPLFTNFDHAGKGCRLTGAAVYYIVRNLGRQINLQVRPHALRHSAITIALDQSNGNVRAVQKFSRHLDIKYLMIYDDNRTDMGSDITQRLSQAV